MNRYKSKQIQLYDYQQQALKDISTAFKSQMAVLMVMATGLGKTMVSAFFANEQFKAGKRGLFLCHENDILDQGMAEFSTVLGREAILKTFYGEDKDWNADKADVLFASFQSFSDWHIVFDQKHFDYIVVDESHHGQARTYKEVIKYFQPEKLLGMTATPNRGDEQDIREIFGEEVVNYSLEESIAKGWLTPIEYHILNDGINNKRLRQIAKEVLEEGQRISVKQLNETIFIQARDEEIAEQIISLDKKTIIFCESIDHVENFQSFLPKSAVFHSKVNSRRNQQVLSEFRKGTIQYILAVNKFNEGIDIPDAEVIVFLRNTDSKRIFMQQLGRGLRLFAGKEKVIVLDFVANCERLMMLKEIARKTKEFAGNHFDLTKEKLMISGDSFNFIFNDEQIDILSILNRLNAEFYETWQKASEAAIALGILSGDDYTGKRGKKKMYLLNPRLPSAPYFYYKDWPGWNIFLGKFYKTWEEASKATIALGILSSAEYRGIRGKQNKRLLDSKLPSNPNAYYEDWPGWKKFLDKFYGTWEEAGKAAIALGILSNEDYIGSKGKEKKCLLDSKLPSNPNIYYEDWPGWKKFLDKFYETWEEAGKAAIALGILSGVEYRGIRGKQNKRLLDSKLPSAPYSYYKDWPGWKKFLA